MIVYYGTDIPVPEHELLPPAARALAAQAAPPPPDPPQPSPSQPDPSAPTTLPVVAEQADPSPLPGVRHDGWTPGRQQRFLEHLAEGATVEAACRVVGLTLSSAYAFRRRANGAAFALGWQAAHVLARDRLADTLLTRAMEGVEERVVRPDGAELVRHRYDTRLSLGMLARLDRLADGPAVGRPAAGTSAAPPAQAAARTVAGAWESYVNLLADPDAADRMDGFVDAVAAAQEAALPPLRTGDAAPAEIAHATPPERQAPDPAPPVWYSHSLACRLTSFPPPPGYDGESWGDANMGPYRRRLTAEEQAALADPAGRAAAAQEAAHLRDAFFHPNRAACRSAVARGRGGTSRGRRGVAPPAPRDVDAAPIPCTEPITP